jgi:hypothetical protein
MPNSSFPRDVVDLDAVRAHRTASTAGPEHASKAWTWTCSECELSAGPFTNGEAAYLAGQHDRIQHLGSPTALLTPARPKLIAS